MPVIKHRNLYKNKQVKILMRSLIVCFLLTLASIQVFSLEKTGVSPADSLVENISKCPKFGEDFEATGVILSILDHVGVCPNFQIKEAHVKNAKAVIRDDHRYIIYNKEYIASIAKKGKTDWAGVFVLAHEIGHHLNGHTLYFDRSGYEAEIEADNFAGFVLRKMGASLNETQAGVSAVCREKCTKSHPGRNARLKAIEKGWNKADKQLKD